MINKVTIPEEVMITIINRALKRARRRKYIMCFNKVAEVYGNAQKARQYCKQIADNYPYFTAADFEVEARKWIQENKAWAYKISSLRRKLRQWARRQYIVKYYKPGVYELI